MKLARELIATGLTLALLCACVSTRQQQALVAHLRVNNAPSQGGTGVAYRVVQSVEGQHAYVDRARLRQVSVPAALRGAVLIRTADGDRDAAAGNSDFLSFQVLQSSTVYVAHDTRITPKPDWLTSAFMNTGTELRIGSRAFDIYSNVYPRDALVVLGSNTAAGGGGDHENMYSVLVVPTAPHAEPPTTPTAIQIVCSTAAVVGLQWAPSRDDVQVAGYRITRDGVLLGTTFNPYFADTTVAASTRYSYAITAFDSAGNTAASDPAAVTTAAASAAGDAPYCPSRLITAMSWDWSTGYTQANGSDLWPAAWGADGNVYMAFGDGGGFGGDNERGRASFGIAMITGEPPPTSNTAHNIYGGYATTHPARVTGKASAIIAVDADFYAIAGIFRPTDLKSEYPHRPSGSPNHLEIASSLGNAYSWQDSDWSFCGVESKNGARILHGAFCPQGFVGYGAGNSGAIDDYVYLYGMDAASYWGNVPSTAPADTYLARVPKGSMLIESAYQYFAGLDAQGAAIWSARAEQMSPVFVDRNPIQVGCRNACTMAAPIEEAVYVSPLNRYIAVAQGGYAAQTSFYEGPSPWGPWAVISYNNIDAATGSGGWAGLGTGAGESLGVHFVNAWTSPSGQTLWATYSSSGTAPADALFPPAGTAMDSINLVKVELALSPGK
jgi:hypothetical protein